MYRPEESQRVGSDPSFARSIHINHVPDIKNLDTKHLTRILFFYKSLPNRPSSRRNIRCVIFYSPFQGLTLLIIKLLKIYICLTFIIFCKVNKLCRAVKKIEIKKSI